MILTRLRLKNFTAFADLDLEFSPGVNVFLGKNGAGKTHLMKVAYTACAATGAGEDFAEQLVRVFRPRRRLIGRLVRRRPGGQTGSVEVHRGTRLLRLEFATNSREADSARLHVDPAWQDDSSEAVFIPVEEVLSRSPGVQDRQSSSATRSPEFPSDLIEQTLRTTHGAPMDSAREEVLQELRLGGRVHAESGKFYLDCSRGNLEFPLVADGFRKLGLLWLLVRNGTLKRDSVLFWDHPEASLNPSLVGNIMEAILKLHRLGVQVFLATHDYVILKELDLRRQRNDRIAFHTLFHDEDGCGAICHTSREYDGILPNGIAEAFNSIWDRTISRDFSRQSK